MSAPVTATPPTAPACAAFQAEAMPGPDGAVEWWGEPITEAEAVQRLQQGLDVVVRGSDRRTNRNEARRLTVAAFGGFDEDQPHQGRMALPHFHPPGRAPPGSRILRGTTAARQTKETMKYLTPELLARCRSLEDDVAEAAAAEWERALLAYDQELKQVRRLLPLGARRLLRNATLHDAVLVNIALKLGEPSSASLLFRLAWPTPRGHRGALLDYRLLAPPEVLAWPDQELAATHRYALYDEFALVRQGEQENGQPPEYTHDILMTGGVELRFRFSDLRTAWLDRTLSGNSDPAELRRELAEASHTPCA
jgi:hypothetical protein